MAATIDPRDPGVVQWCDQLNCGGLRAFRFTWPGKPEKICCQSCSVRAKSIAFSMGFDLHLVPVLS